MSLRVRLDLLNKEIEGHRDAQVALATCIIDKCEQAKALKQQVADAEVTYSVGDRLGFEDGVGERLIVSVGKYISIVDIEDGRSVGYIDDCVDKKKITKAELARINVCLEYIKIYDARKQSANN